MPLRRPNLDDLIAATTAASPATPLAAEVAKGIPIYAMDPAQLGNPKQKAALQQEWAEILMDGAGVIVLRGAYRDTALLDAVSDVFNTIIADEAEHHSGADHFATAGSNSRIWNSLQKLALRRPGLFVQYHGNAIIDAVCEAWLGPGYQLTAQVNVVRPGGAAQQAHRDYHLGFQPRDRAAAYPAHVHALSPVLTLQGAIAHIDTPIDSGPTKLLPGSQRYLEGYLAFREPEVRDYFEAHCVQLPLRAGDAVFFNPALLHAAGANHTHDVHRLVNLLQVSSAFGRSLEAIDRRAICEQVYPKLLTAHDKLSDDEITAAIAASGEGYPFPTNLDTDPPVGGLAPATQQDLLHRALNARLSSEKFNAELAAMCERQRP